MSNVQFNRDAASSMKSHSDGEVWDPSSVEVVGGDGKKYKKKLMTPDPNNKERVGYYLRTETFTSKQYSDRPSNVHVFKGLDDKIWKIFGCTALDKQMQAVAANYGPGYLCLVEFKGRVLKPDAKNKPKDVLTNTDFYKDMEVIVDTTATPIKVAGVNVTIPTNPHNVVTTGASALPQDLPPDFYTDQLPH